MRFQTLDGMRCVFSKSLRPIVGFFRHLFQKQQKFVQKMTSIIYKIRLNYEPSCNTIDLSEKTLTKLLKKRHRILKIIENSLFGFDILKHSMSDGTFAALICPNGDVDFESLNASEFLEARYKDSAQDTWIKGNVPLGFLNNKHELVDKHQFDVNLHTVKLDITLQSIVNGVQTL